MGEAAKKEPEETYVMVGPGAEDLPDPSAPATTEDVDKAAPETDTRDARLGGGREDDEPDAAERPRESSRERRERQKRANERIRKELEYYKTHSQELATRVQRLEGRSTQAETTAAEQRLNTLKAQINNAGRVMAEAMSAAAGGDKTAKNDYEQALQIRDDLQRELNKLEFAKDVPAAFREQRQQQSPTAQAASRLDPVAAALGRKWIKAHPWFDPSGEDEDSEIVLLVDDQLRKRGYDPADDEHWEELEARLRKLLPDRFKAGGARRTRGDDDDFEDDDEADARPRNPNPRSSGPRFSSGGRERPLKKGEVYVSAERKQALQLAGKWDDPAERQKMLKRYAEMDAQIAREKTG